MLTTLLVLVVTAGLLYGAYWASITLGQKALEKQDLERHQASEARKLKRLAEAKRGRGVRAPDDQADDGADAGDVGSGIAFDEDDDPDSPVGRLTITTKEAEDAPDVDDAADPDDVAAPDDDTIGLAGPSEPRRPSRPPAPPRRASPDDSGPIPLE